MDSLKKPKNAAQYYCDLRYTLDVIARLARDEVESDPGSPRLRQLGVYAETARTQANDYRLAQQEERNRYREEVLAMATPLRPIADQAAAEANIHKLQADRTILLEVNRKLECQARLEQKIGSEYRHINGNLGRELADVRSQLNQARAERASVRKTLDTIEADPAVSFLRELGPGTHHIVLSLTERDRPA